MQRFTPLLVVDAARPRRRAVGDRWLLDETHVKVAGTWRYLCRAVDQYGQVIGVYVSNKRNTTAATTFFAAAIAAREGSVEISADKSVALEESIREVLPRRRLRHHPIRQQRTSRTTTAG